VCVCVCVHVRTCVRVCVGCVGRCVSAFVCVCVHPQTHTPKHTHPSARAQTHPHPHTRTLCSALQASYPLSWSGLPGSGAAMSTAFKEFAHLLTAHPHLRSVIASSARVRPILPRSRTRWRDGLALLQTLAHRRMMVCAMCRGTVPRGTTPTAALRRLTSVGPCLTRSAASHACRLSRACTPLCKSPLVPLRFNRRV
jgi:hypothetical protein